MREPPANLNAETLLAPIWEHYGLRVTECTFLPLGHDAEAWVYRVSGSDDKAYFLKLRRHIKSEAGLLTPRFLQQQGIEGVVGPLLTLSAETWAETEGYALALYPFVDGSTARTQAMTEEQWRTYGRLLRRIHDTQPSSELAAFLPQDGYRPAGIDLITEIDQLVRSHAYTGFETEDMARTWIQQRSLILDLRARALDLGQRLAQTAPARVLCHADIHSTNILLSANGQVWFVDWDETSIAPRERDLMFIVGRISSSLIGPREEALFFEGYGAWDVDPLALSYYRHAWAVNDIADFGQQVFLRQYMGSLTRQSNVPLFKSLFQPGEIVSIALASERS